MSNKIEKKVENIRMLVLNLTSSLAKLNDDEGIDLWLEVLSYINEKLIANRQYKCAVLDEEF